MFGTGNSSTLELVELGANSKFLVDLEFLELTRLARKNWSRANFLDLELFGAVPNTPLTDVWQLLHGLLDMPGFCGGLLVVFCRKSLTKSLSLLSIV